MPNFIITSHAIERYRERITPVVYSSAKTEIRRYMQTAKRLHVAALGGGELWQAETFIAVCTVDQFDRKSLVVRTVLTPKMAHCADELLESALQDAAALSRNEVPEHYRPGLSMEKKRIGALIALAQMDQARWREVQKTERAHTGAETMRQILHRIYKGENCKAELDAMFAEEKTRCQSTATTETSF